MPLWNVQLLFWQRDRFFWETRLGVFRLVHVFPLKTKPKWKTALTWKVSVTYILAGFGYRVVNKIWFQWKCWPITKICNKISLFDNLSDGAVIDSLSRPCTGTFSLKAPPRDEGQVWSNLLNLQQIGSVYRTSLLSEWTKPNQWSCPD